MLFRFERFEDVFYWIVQTSSCSLFELRTESGVLWYLDSTWLMVMVLALFEIAL